MTLWTVTIGDDINNEVLVSSDSAAKAMSRALGARGINSGIRDQKVYRSERGLSEHQAKYTFCGVSFSVYATEAKVLLAR